MSRTLTCIVCLELYYVGECKKFPCYMYHDGNLVPLAPNSIYGVTPSMDRAHPAFPTYLQLGLFSSHYYLDDDDFYRFK